MIDYVDTHEMFKPLKAMFGTDWLMHCYETVERDKGKALFAQRMMEAWPEKLVYVLANPSSAVICAYKALPMFARSEVWIATGSDTLTMDHLIPLWDRDVVFFPTARQYDQWRDAMPWLDVHPGTFIVDSTMDMLASCYSPAIDWDLATMALMPHDIRWAFFNGVMGDLTPLLQLLGCQPRPDNIRQWCEQNRLAHK